MPPVVDSELCIACGKCVEICPLDVMKMKDDKIVVMYPDECWHCRACVMDCPRDAIRMRYPLSTCSFTISAGTPARWTN